VSNLRRIPYTKPLPPGAEVFTRKGKRFARWQDSKGKRREAPLNEDVTRIQLLSSKWYGEYRDPDGTEHCVPLFTDRTASELRLAELVKLAERKEVGAADPFGDHSKRPLLCPRCRGKGTTPDGATCECPNGSHLTDYRRSHLEARGNAPRYTDLVVSRLADLLAGCGFVFPRDLSASRVMDWLAGLRRNGGGGGTLPPGKQQWTRKELAALLGVKPASVSPLVRRHRLPAAGKGKARRYPRTTVEALLDRQGRGASVETTNQYLTHLKGFGRWLAKDNRIGQNPFEHLEPGNSAVDRRHDRRELDAEELRRLLTAARDSGRTFRGLTGPDRFHLYATACGTGFRASGLASLTPERFDLDSDPATVTLAARRNKSRKLKEQPLPADVAGLLREYLRDRPAGQPVWGGTWAADRVAADMLRIDLEAAGIPYAVEGPDGPLYADFHALRHSYLTLGGRAGIDLRTLQELAGHSTPVLTARYSHRRLHDLAGAVEKLPSLLPGDAPAPALRATGTEGTVAAEESGTPAVLSLRQACAADEAGSGSVMRADAAAGGEGQNANRPQVPLSGVVEAGCGSLIADDSRAGDRIRTGDVQLGKLPFVAAEKRNNPVGRLHFTRPRPSCKPSHSFAKSSKETRYSGRYVRASR
jgi:integrase